MASKYIEYRISFITLIILCIPTVAFSGPILRLFQVMELACFAWAILVFFARRMYRKTALYPIWAFFAWAFFSTIINRNDLSDFFFHATPILSAVISTQHMYNIRKWKAVNSVASLFSILLVIQGFTKIMGGMNQIIDGNGLLQTNYFFGQRVTISQIFLFALGVIMLSLVTETKKHKQFILYSGCISSIFFIVAEKVSTAYMGLLTVIMVLVIARILKSERVWRNLLIMGVVFIVLFSVSLNQSGGFRWLLVDFLGEDVTLNGRVFLWQDALQRLTGAKWLWGHGYGHNILFTISGFWFVGHPHSQYIEMLFTYGIIGLCLYVYFVFKQIPLKKHSVPKKIRVILIAICAASIVTGVATETFKNVYMYVYYVAAVNTLEIFGYHRLPRKRDML